MSEDLTGFNHDFATALIFTETVLGGDPLNPDGQFRHFVDAYYSGLSLPPLYHEPEAEAIRATLDKDGNPINHSLQQFLDKHSPKYNAAYMVRVEGRAPADVEALLQLEYFVNPNLAYRLAHKWAANPLIAGTYAPAYGFGTRVAEAIVKNMGLEQGIHYLFGVHGKAKSDIRQLKRAFHAATLANTNYRTSLR